MFVLQYCLDCCLFVLVLVSGLVVLLFCFVICDVCLLIVLIVCIYVVRIYVCLVVFV